MKIIPAIDIIGGKCVRLTQGDYGKMKVYRENPVDVAKEFEEADLEYLHLVDLDGAKKGKVINWKVIESIQAQTALKVDPVSKSASILQISLQGAIPAKNEDFLNKICVDYIKKGIELKNE